MGDELPTLHHLNNSQSQRILWLLEELKIPYNVKLYNRSKTHRAPPEMTKIHPMGRSPILVTSDGRAIAESSAIATYLLTTYDREGKFQGGPAAENDAVRDEALSSFANNTLGIINFLQLFLDILVGASPFFVRPILGMLSKQMGKAFSRPEYARMLSYLEQELEGRDYFMGSSPGRADFMMSWPMDMMEQRGYVDLKAYPKIHAWRERCQGREAWKKALEKGNGYDLKALGTS